MKSSESVFWYLYGGFAYCLNRPTVVASTRIAAFYLVRLGDECSSVHVALMYCQYWLSIISSISLALISILL